MVDSRGGNSSVYRVVLMYYGVWIILRLAQWVILGMILGCHHVWFLGWCKGMVQGVVLRVLLGLVQGVVLGVANGNSVGTRDGTELCTGVVLGVVLGELPLVPT